MKINESEIYTVVPSDWHIGIWENWIVLYCKTNPEYMFMIVTQCSSDDAKVYRWKSDDTGWRGDWCLHLETTRNEIANAISDLVSMAT